MVPLTRLSGSVFALNADLIERVDSTPDTIITLMNGTKYVVAESMPAVIAVVRRHRAEVMAMASLLEVELAAAPADSQDWQAARTTAAAAAEPPVRRPNLLVVGPADLPAASGLDPQGDDDATRHDGLDLDPTAPRHSAGGSPS